MGPVGRSLCVAAAPSHQPRRSRRALALVLIVLVPLLSGCISIDYFLPQADAVEGEPTGNGLLRIFIAVAPGAIGAEFAHYNVTWGRSFAYLDAAATQPYPLNSTFVTSDLVLMERHRKAAMIASAELAPGTYHGFTHQSINATITTERVVGNDDGQEVLGHETQVIDVHTKLGQVRYEYGVFSQLTTDIFLEIDMQASLVDEGDGLRHATKVLGLSMYVNGMKADEERYTAGAPRRGSGGGYGDIPKENLLPPVSRYEVYDDETDAMLHDSDDWDKRYPKVIGLGQDLRFKSRSWSHVYVNQEQLDIRELFWDFADGTTRYGGTVTHNWTSGGIYDVALRATDEYGLTKRTHSTFVVPYRADEAVKKEVERRSGTFLVGHHGGDTGADVMPWRVTEELVFPEDLDEGDLRLGAYRVTTHAWDPVSGVTDGLQRLQMRVTSGEQDEVTTGTDTLLVETAGLTFWRGRLTEWVEPEVTVTLDLETGVDVGYEIVVEALYFENMTKGFDPHPTHRHGDWVIGPRSAHLASDGTAPTKE